MRNTLVDVDTLETVPGVMFFLASPFWSFQGCHRIQLRCCIFRRNCGAERVQGAIGLSQAMRSTCQDPGPVLFGRKRAVGAADRVPAPLKIRAARDPCLTFTSSEVELHIHSAHSPIGGWTRQPLSASLDFMTFTSRSGFDARLSILFT